MLERFNSFYKDTIAPMAHKGWEKIPTDKVSDFFQKTVPNFLHKAWDQRPSLPSFNKINIVPSGLPHKVSDFFQKTVPTFTQSAWDRRPSFPTIKKIALIPIGLFALYKACKWIQPIFYGKGPNQPPEKDPRIPPEETDESDDDSQDSQEGDKVEKAEQRSENGANGNHDQNVLLQSVKQDIDEGELSDHDSDYATASDGEDDTINPPLFSQKPESPQHEELSPLEQFSSNFPGQHLECTIGEDNAKLSDFVLNKLFRIHERPQCKIDENGWYTLTHRDSRVITISQLPPTQSQKVKILALRKIIQGIMWIFTPQFEMSRVMKVQIIQVRYEIEDNKQINGTRIIFDQNSIFLSQNKPRYTAHLKSITICDEPINKGRHIEIELEHNSKKIEDKGGYLHIQQFVDTLNLYLQ